MKKLKKYYYYGSLLYFIFGKNEKKNSLTVHLPFSHDIIKALIPLLVVKAFYLIM